MAIKEITPDFRKMLKRRVAYHMAYGNEKHETMSLNMIAVEMGVSDNLIRRILRKETTIIREDKLNKINSWFAKYEPQYISDLHKGLENREDIQDDKRN